MNILTCLPTKFLRFNFIHRVEYSSMLLTPLFIKHCNLSIMLHIVVVQCSSVRM